MSEEKSITITAKHVLIVIIVLYVLAYIYKNIL